MAFPNDLKRASFKHKNNKAAYYIKGYLRLLLPPLSRPKDPETRLARLPAEEQAYVLQRVNYYNKLHATTPLPDRAVRLSELKVVKRHKTYMLDLMEYTRHFPQQLRVVSLFGDITTVPDCPSIVKSRPIHGDNANSVVFKLDKIRHFLFVCDKNRFADKRDMLVGRSNAHQPHRVAFLEKYFGHPLCNVGQVNRDQNTQYIAPRLTIEEHLKYKFILCLEGYDVASNLKWVMSSNSIAVMPRPKYETWFMEGTLVPDYHYIEIKDDYSDLEERLRYYMTHTDEALQIIGNAHRYVAQFKDKRREDLIALLVLKKYFDQHP